MEKQFCAIYLKHPDPSGEMYTRITLEHKVFNGEYCSSDLASCPYLNEEDEPYCTLFEERLAEFYGEDTDTYFTIKCKQCHKKCFGG